MESSTGGSTAGLAFLYPQMLSSLTMLTILVVRGKYEKEVSEVLRCKARAQRVRPEWQSLAAGSLQDGLC